MQKIHAHTAKLWFHYLITCLASCCPKVVRQCASVSLTQQSMAEQFGLLIRVKSEHRRYQYLRIFTVYVSIQHGKVKQAVAERSDVLHGVFVVPFSI
jgi:hypothetical protein